MYSAAIKKSKIRKALHNKKTMAAVYKTIAKKRSRREAAEAEMPPNNGDIVMQDDFSSESDSEDEDENDRMEDVAAGKANQAGAYMPKTRVLMLTSRGVTHRSVDSLNLTYAMLTVADTATSYLTSPPSSRTPIRKQNSTQRRNLLVITFS